MPNLGKSGELVRVRPGFARNFLIPRRLAMGATAGNVARIEHQKKGAEARAAKVTKEANDLATKLSALKGVIGRQVGEGDKLYGSVTSRRLQEAVPTPGFLLRSPPTPHHRTQP